MNIKTYTTPIVLVCIIIACIVGMIVAATAGGGSRAAEISVYVLGIASGILFLATMGSVIRINHANDPHEWH